MKVGIVNTMVPFGWGGAEELAHHLVQQMILRRIDAELIRIPFAWEPPEKLVAQMLLCRNLQLSASDRIIGLRFPAYLVPHCHKVLWLLHQFRQAYDLWATEFGNIPATDQGHRLRGAVIDADNICFGESHHIWVNHRVTQERLRHFNGVAADILMPPLNDPELFTGGQSQGYMLASGRINDLKRQWLLVEAMRHTSPDVRLVIAGPPEAQGDADRLQRLVAENGLEGRVRLILEFIPRPRLAQLVNESAAVAYIPYDEDSVGYVTMEALHAGKPVLTSCDSGGVLDVISDRRSGIVAQADPESLGRALEELVQNPGRSQDWGLQGRSDWLQLGVTWDLTIERLLS